MKETFRGLTKDDILQPCISDHDFRSYNEDIDVGYILYVFDIRYQENVTAVQIIEVEFRFDGVVPANNNGYPLVLTNKVVSVSVDGQQHFGVI